MIFKNDNIFTFLLFRMSPPKLVRTIMRCSRLEHSFRKSFMYRANSLLSPSLAYEMQTVLTKSTLRRAFSIWNTISVSCLFWPIYTTDDSFLHSSRKQIGFDLDRTSYFSCNSLLLRISSSLNLYSSRNISLKRRSEEAK